MYSLHATTCQGNGTFGTMHTLCVYIKICISWCIYYVSVSTHADTGMIRIHQHHTSQRFNGFMHRQCDGKSCGDAFCQSSLLGFWGLMEVSAQHSYVHAASCSIRGACKQTS